MTNWSGFEATEQDEQDFIDLLDRLVTSVLEHRLPKELYIVQIDNWFDHKWLKFSGLAVVESPWIRHAFPEKLGISDECLKATSLEEVTLPPFTPERIRGQWCFERTERGYVESPISAPHSWKRQMSSLNLKQGILVKSDSALFVWFSSNTTTNDRASVMMYEVSEGHVRCWFASFRRNPAWRLEKTKGIATDIVQKYLEASF